jgi:hypothetical protein
MHIVAIDNIMHTIIFITIGAGAVGFVLEKVNNSTLYSKSV